jgi:hypothetical protein
MSAELLFAAGGVFVVGGGVLAPVDAVGDGVGVGFGVGVGVGVGAGAVVAAGLSAVGSGSFVLQAPNKRMADTRATVRITFALIKRLVRAAKQRRSRLRSKQPGRQPFGTAVWFCSFFTRRSRMR